MMIPDKDERSHVFLLSSTLTGYLAAAGLVTTATVAGRDLVRSVRMVPQGQYSEAGLHALAALATPVVLAQPATPELLVDELDADRQMLGQTLNVAETTLVMRGKPRRP